MKFNPAFLLLMPIISCNNNNSRNAECHDLSGKFFRGNAVFFFHKPVSGSTYQIYLFPICKNISTNEDFVKAVFNENLKTGISFNLVSDDPQFQYVYKNANRINLAESEELASNFKSIYYCIANIDIDYDLDTLMSKKVMKQLDIWSHSIVLNYHFLSEVSLKVDSIIIN